MRVNILVIIISSSIASNIIIMTSAIIVIGFVAIINYIQINITAIITSIMPTFTTSQRLYMSPTIVVSSPNVYLPAAENRGIFYPRAMEFMTSTVEMPVWIISSG